MKKSNLYIWQFDPVRMTPYYNHAVCVALAEAGCKVRYITTRFLYDEAVPSSALYQTDHVYFRILEHKFLLNHTRLRRGLRGVSYPLGHLRVLREAWSMRPDVIHFQWSRLPLFDFPLIRALKLAGIPIVHTVHNIVPHSATEGGVKTHRRIYEAVDSIVVHTEGNRDEFRAIYPQIPAERVHVVPMIDSNSDDAEAQNGHVRRDKQEARDLLNLPLDAPIILFFGAIRHYKGLDLLIEAFKQAHIVRPDLHLLIAGKLDPTERALLPSAETLRGLPNTTFHDGFVPSDDVWKYYTAADIVVHPYRQITQSAALISAMSFGRAVIVSDVGGMHEALDGNGWVIPTGNVQALSKALIDAITDMNIVEKMGQQSRHLIETRHSRQAVAQKLLEVYQTVL